MKEKKIQELYGALKVIEVELRCYCHDEKCERVYECPGLHEKCREKLDLDTSIAWELACTLRLITQWMEKDRKLTRDYLQEALPAVEFLDKAVWNHRQKYPELLRLVREALFVLPKLWDLLEEEAGTEERR